MSRASSEPISSLQVIVFAGFAVGLLVFVVCMMLGISIDPRADLPSRLLAYTTALGGLTTAFACRWAMAERRAERIAYALLSSVLLICTVVYGLVML